MHMRKNRNVNITSWFVEIKKKKQIEFHDVCSLYETYKTEYGWDWYGIMFIDCCEYEAGAKIAKF